MQTVKQIWHILVGIKDAMVLLLLLLFFILLFAALSAGGDPRANRGGALLLDLNGVITEQPVAVDPRDAITGNVPTGHQFRLRDVVRAIETAAKDDKIKTVVLDLDSFMGGGATSLQRVGEALDKVRAAKKPVLAFATGYTDAGYTLAAHADEVWMDPMGAVLFTGPGGTRPYFKGLADRLSATVNVYRVGKYKSFVEPYVRTEASPEAKAEDQALADALWEEWQADVTKARPKAKVAAMAGDPAAAVKAAGGELAKAALANGLVDKLAARTEFSKRVAQIAGEGDGKHPGDFQSSRFAAYLAAHPEKGGSEDIGIITIAGSIVDGEAPSGTAGGKTVSDLIHKALAERDLKALVVRVNSPGGSAFAAEEMRRALLDVKAKGIPIVISMGNVAASGGYWVSMVGDTIFADPATITGSIGVFSVFPTFEKALPRIGITADGVATTPLSGQPDLLRGTNETTDALMQAGVEDIYRRFTNMVAEKRKMSLDKVLEVAQGRVWAGGAARQIGLVDRFGSLDDAIAEAARLAKVEADDVNRVWIEPGQGLLSGLLGDFMGTRAQAPSADIFTRLAWQQQALAFSALDEARGVMTGPTIQVRCIQCPPTAPFRTSAGSAQGLSGLMFETLFPSR